MGFFMTNLSDIRSVEALRVAQATGRNLSYVFFPDSGSVTDPPTASCLSQWGHSPFDADGCRFLSAEQAMMHGKAVLFGDLEMAGRILAARTPYQAKSLGAQVRGFSEEIWMTRRFEVVVAANLPKFATNPVLRDYLLSTGDAILVESSATDRIWGAGVDEYDRDAKNPDRWPGLNLLGFALMQVRALIRKVSA
ncbi:MAG: hypothetical protein RL173_2188 [Fibrobacterota bacterium]|jgi:ribA/ribD-fused uncharacterized protein